MVLSGGQVAGRVGVKGVTGAIGAVGAVEVCNRRGRGCRHRWGVGRGCRGEDAGPIKDTGGWESSTC